MGIRGWFATWTMADGQVIRIRKMTDDHLINCLYMLRRAGKRTKAYKLRVADAVLDTFYFDEPRPIEIRCEETPWTNYVPRVHELLLELIRRQSKPRKYKNEMEAIDDRIARFNVEEFLDG